MKRQVNLTLEIDLVSKIDKIGRIEGMSRSKLVEFVFEQYLEAYEKQSKRDN